MQNYVDNKVEARDYQTNLVQTALKQNTIVYLPAGTGKTFIAVMVLRQLAKPLKTSLSQGGKLSIMVVNTHALVNQQSQYLQRLTPFDVLACDGKKNVNSRNKTVWQQTLDKYQILVITPKVLINMLQASVLKLSNINLLIFDECHRAVNNHPMRQIMENFIALEDPPRIVGLTATLVNRNCVPQKVLHEIRTLETTLHSKVATAKPHHIVEFSTNPKEILKIFKEVELTAVIIQAIQHLQDVISVIEPLQEIENDRPIVVENQSSRPFTEKKKLKDIVKLIKDTIIQIETFGIFGGRIAVIARILQLEIAKGNYQDRETCIILEAVITALFFVKKVFENEMVNCSENKWLYTFSSHKVHTFINILKEYQDESKELLCGIVFVKRRFTAKVLYHILLCLKVTDSEFKDVNPNFVLGSNTNCQCSNSLQFHSVTTYKNIMEDFLNNKVNLLVASNVLEEGVDVPTCTLVINFDVPLNYPAYVQSKGRARHKNSFYYLMIDNTEYKRFKSTYEVYQKVEEELNAHLSGCSKNGCKLLFNEDVTAQCNELTFPAGCGTSELPCVSPSLAANLLNQYCLSLPCDEYTSYRPTWSLEQIKNQNGLYRAIIKLPTLSEPAEGPCMETKESAAGAAALKACKLLLEKGKLNDDFMPKQYTVIDEDKKSFFKHWPQEEEPDAGNSKRKKVYDKQIPLVSRGQIRPNRTVFLHIIEQRPTWTFDTSNIKQSVIQQVYSSQKCYGILTSQVLPKLCEFPVYVVAGEIIVDFKVNHKVVILSASEIAILKTFHYFIFKEILEALKGYLVFNNEEDAEILLVVPVEKQNDDYKISFDLCGSKQLHQTHQNSMVNQKKRSTEETYLGEIVATYNSNKTMWRKTHKNEYIFNFIFKNVLKMMKMMSFVNSHLENT